MNEEWLFSKSQVTSPNSSVISFKTKGFAFYHSVWIWLGTHCPKRISRFWKRSEKLPEGCANSRMKNNSVVCWLPCLQLCQPKFSPSVTINVYGLIQLPVYRVLVTFQTLKGIWDIREGLGNKGPVVVPQWQLEATGSLRSGCVCVVDWFTSSTDTMTRSLLTALGVHSAEINTNTNSYTEDSAEPHHTSHTRQDKRCS